MMVRVWNGTRMQQLGAEGENRDSAAFRGSAARCHAGMAWARPCSCRGKGRRRLSPSLSSFHRPPLRAVLPPAPALAPAIGQDPEGSGRTRSCTGRRHLPMLCHSLASTMAATANRASPSSHLWDRNLWPDAISWQGNSSRAWETLRIDAKKHLDPSCPPGMGRTQMPKPPGDPRTKFPQLGPFPGSSSTKSPSWER